VPSAVPVGTGNSHQFITILVYSSQQTVNSVAVFRISPIVKITLISLYIALTIPLPFLAEFTNAPVPLGILWVGMAIGFIVILAILSELVILDDEKISVTYSFPIARFWLKGWSLNWSEIAELKLRTTGQNGIVYYFITTARDRAYLLPMRVAGFARMVDIVTEKTGIDTNDVRPLSQPWMYLILFACTLILLLLDCWVIVTANR
jgi:hypothetical protein